MDIDSIEEFGALGKQTTSDPSQAQILGVVMSATEEEMDVALGNIISLPGSSVLFYGMETGDWRGEWERVGETGNEHAFSTKYASVALLDLEKREHREIIWEAVTLIQTKDSEDLNYNLSPALGATPWRQSCRFPWSETNEQKPENISSRLALMGEFGDKRFTYTESMTKNGSGMLCRYIQKQDNLKLNGCPLQCPQVQPHSARPELQPLRKALPPQPPHQARSIKSVSRLLCSFYKL
ncbi:hypothetical protein MJG53_019952 [Ovis ammon polii x Ovis aries]|uniref:Uncharacterized protein n=1 Tax=Ovis ammon polii x Ovis aries TaxID=2918886 RepID=A0ACB9U1A7_9CETA|nr:hypothetical protein MJG53_019952 [Ovis ammon polii x Ovis aries]